MKIINARNGQLQQIPFSLGESGRGRWLEEVKVSNRDGQAPSGPEDVGYFLFGEKQKHCILTRSNPQQRGILLRINTQGTYTRNSSGEVILKGGPANLLVKGNFAHGDAGGIGSASDELWHVEGPSVFVVNLEGGSHKGYGHRYLIVTKNFKVTMITRSDLCQLIATDSDPEMTEVVREFADELHADVRSALATAEALEEAFEAPTVAVTHLVPEGRAIEAQVHGFGIAIPPAMANGPLGGVAEVKAKTLLPGENALAYFEIGPGGGKRYHFEVKAESGIARVAEETNDKVTRQQVLAIIDSPDWQSAWVEYKDGEVTAYCLADAGGIHSYYAYDDPRRGESRIHSRGWEGVAIVAPSEADMDKIFGLSWGDEQPTEAAQAPEGGWTVADLAAKFNSGK